MVFFKFIATSCTGIGQTFGKFSGTFNPGLTFYLPIIQKISVINNRLQQDSFKFNVKTKDNVFVTLGLDVQFQVKPEDSEKAFFSMNDPLRQINSYIENTVRSRVPKMKLDELFESQDDICKSVETELAQKMTSYGYTIQNTLVTDIMPAQEVVDAMNKINASERLKEAAKNEADANYIKKVREAEADRDRKILQGQGTSGQRLAIIDGFESGVSKMAKNLGTRPADIMEFVLKVQELDTMQDIGKSNNSKTIFFEKGKSLYFKDTALAKEA